MSPDKKNLHSRNGFIVSNSNSPVRSTDKKITRVVVGHAMPVRDLNKGAPMKHHLRD